MTNKCFEKVRIRNCKSYEEFCNKSLNEEGISIFMFCIPIIGTVASFIYGMYLSIQYIFDYKIVYKEVKIVNKIKGDIK